MKIEGIIFDKDGTLIDFYKTWIPAAIAVVDNVFVDYEISESMDAKEKVLNAIGISENQVAPDSSFAWKTYDDIARDMQSVLEQLLSKKIDVHSLGNKLANYFEEEICENGKMIECAFDLPSIIKSLNSQNINIGIATTDTYRATIKCLDKIGILKYFTFFAMDKMPNYMPLKPSREIITKAAKYWDIDSEKILVVGDTLNDMRFAHNGGAIAVGVLSGVSKRQDLQAMADYIIDSVADLPELIYTIEKRKI